MNDLRAAFDPDWQDRGINSAYFGELNPSHNSEMPATLVETAFHATAADAAWLKEPRFRQVLARAYYQGVAQYFAQRDQIPVALLPEPPRQLTARSTGPGEITVSWQPPDPGPSGLAGDAPTHYRVATSVDGRAFDDGVFTAPGATSHVFDGASTGAPVFFRVTSLNPGGESFPTAVVPVVPGCPGAAQPALLVHGFDRLDAASLPVDDLSPWALGEIVRLRQREVNTFDYLVDHAWSFAAAGVALDGAVASAITGGAVSMDDYALVDWQLGEESSGDDALDADEQAAITAWLEGGPERTLLVSGAELGWDLVEKGSPADVAFFEDVLGVDYLADDAGTYGLSATIGALEGAFAGAGFGVEAGAPYDVDFADVLGAQAGGQVLVEYAAGAGAAVVAHDAPSGSRSVAYGGPMAQFVEPAV